MIGFVNQSYASTEGNDDVTSNMVTVLTESISTVVVTDLTVLVGGILGAVLFLFIVITCIIFCCINRPKKKKVNL